MADNETIADIIAEMRRGTRLPGYWRSCDVNEILQYHADRLEAAQKREKAAIEADALEVGGIVEAAHIRELSKNVSKNGADFGQLGDAAREMRYLASRLLREWQDAVGSNPKFSRYGCMVRRYEKEFNELVREFDKKQLTAIGDAAKLREALEFCVKGMCGFCRMDAEARGMTTRCVHGCEALLMAKAALSAPPRNCDVGTAEEQSERMDAAYCSKRLCAKGKCPLFKPGLDCSLIWAQMHYKEGGAK